MKVLWIVNTPIDALGERLYDKRINGVWMDALLSDYRKRGGFDLAVATAAKIKKTICFESNGVKFYAVPDNLPILYDEKKRSNYSAWREMIEKEQPDLVQVWGTEFGHACCAIHAAKDLNIRSVIYMQGFMGSIARHYLAGMTHKEIISNITLRDILKHDNIEDQQKKFYAAAKRETTEFNISGNVICENKWCEQGIKAVSPNTNIYTCPLSISEEFTAVKRTRDSYNRHTIICNASGYSIKGLHILLRAVALLKREYPDVKLLVPGSKMVSSGSVTQSLRKRGYNKYIEKLIKQLDLKDNIIWLGYLLQKDLAEYYAKSHVFVLCSSIENHSSSLKEAMMVGLPCVASAVGGIPEYLRHGENGFLYRFEEYDIAAAYISEIFKDDDLAQRLGSLAREEIIKLHETGDIYNRILEIYNSVLSQR